MKSRTKKWAHYREKIKKLPPEKFSKRKDYTEVASVSDLAAMNGSAKAANAISNGNLHNVKTTPYSVYQRRRRNMLIFKLATTAVVFAGFICALVLMGHEVTNMEKFITVAIDGPAAAGKSTIAKRVAKLLNYTYLDTGAMYRAVTYAVIKAGLDPEIEEESVKVLPGLKIDLKEDGTVLCNGEDVTKVIREPIVSSKVSYIAAMKPIRLALVDMQREMANSKNVILDGRDIGTYVLPNANVKIFQIASVECRAKRRYIENLEKGIPSTLEEITESVKKRDYIDSHRDFAPLRKAEDAVEIDTSDMTIEESVDAVLAVIKEKTGVKIPCH